MIPKYKAWVKKEKKMYNVLAIEWLSDGTLRRLKLTNHPLKKQWFYYNEVSLLQFIGLKNKNGREIFEGYIIKTDKMVWLVEPIFSQDRDKSFYGICVSLCGSGKCLAIDESILKGEVIGNIYENPELLKEEEK